MVSLVEIGNRALINLKRETLISWNDGSVAGQRLQEIWPTVRDAVLRDYPWSCATGRALLAKQTEAPAWGAVNQYKRLPDDLKVRALNVDKYTKWRVEGRSIVTNAEAPLGVLYTRRVTDPTIYDALLVDALQHKLTSALAIPLTQKSSFRTAAENAYERAKIAAEAVDGQEASEELFQDDEWLRSREIGVVGEIGEDAPWV